MFMNEFSLWVFFEMNLKRVIYIALNVNVTNTSRSLPVDDKHLSKKYSWRKDTW